MGKFLSEPAEEIPLSSPYNPGFQNSIQTLCVYFIKHNIKVLYKDGVSVRGSLRANTVSTATLKYKTRRFVIEGLSLRAG